MNYEHFLYHEFTRHGINFESNDFENNLFSGVYKSYDKCKIRVCIRFVGEEIFLRAFITYNGNPHLYIDNGYRTVCKHTDENDKAAEIILRQEVENVMEQCKTLESLSVLIGHDKNIIRIK